MHCNKLPYRYLYRTEFFFFYKVITSVLGTIYIYICIYICIYLCRHLNLQKRTIAKYTTGLTVQEIQIPETRIKSASNSWEKRPGGIDLLINLKQYWKDHLVTSPKKNDIVFKHVRGHGKHTLQEINGLKEMICAPGLT